MLKRYQRMREMTTKLNLHKLMYRDAGYLHALKVSDDDREALAEARELIRETLRGAFRNWEQYVSKAQFRDARIADASIPFEVPAPKFKIQGSFAYFTANDCQHPPRQQIDQDDGVFLPLSFVTVQGKARPTIASSAYFLLVERALKPLCDRKGWTLNPREEKGSCVRVEISPRLHIDLPLYAIRDTAFEEMIELHAERLQKALIRDARELDEGIYRELGHAEIILAHRKHGWIESDPRKLETWFANAINLYGENVRELSRAFKGLRDAKLDDGLSSICIMACVVRAIEQLGRQDNKRLDVALINVSRAIALCIGEPVDNPVFPGDPEKRLCVDWDEAYRLKVRALFSDAADQLEEAVDGTFHRSVAITKARAAFGPRVPHNEDLIVLGGASAAVRSVAPVRQPQPVVPRTKSG
jgi:hypothetical protein